LNNERFQVMTEATEYKKLRRAELISPPNRLKEKVGSGGIDETVILKAQALLEDNTVDFRPIATLLVDILEDALRDTKAGILKGEAAIESMIYPAMQLKAQGSMFHYPLITEISDILVDFLETVPRADDDVMDVVSGHRMAIKVVIASDIRGDGGIQGKELKEALHDACSRYYKTNKTQKK
jgi:hypothetical protein